MLTSGGGGGFEVENGSLVATVGTVGEVVVLVCMRC